MSGYELQERTNNNSLLANSLLLVITQGIEPRSGGS